MLDLRLPIGLVFSAVGLLLVIYGLKTVGDAEVYKCSLGINVNLWWGLVLTVFGGLMLLSSRRGAADDGKQDPSA